MSVARPTFLSRRDFIKAAGVVAGSLALVSCTPNNPPPLIDPGGWEAISDNIPIMVENFTERYLFDINFDALANIAEEYGIPKENYNNLDINFLPQSEVGIDGYGGEYLQVGFKEDGRAVINVGVGYFDGIVMKDRGHLPQQPDEIGYLSGIISSVVFDGYGIVASKRGLISKSQAEKSSKKYYDLIFNSKEDNTNTIIIYTYLKPLDSSTTQP